MKTRTHKKIYALQAHGERGKSTALKILILKILKEYKTELKHGDNIYTLKMIKEQLENECNEEYDKGQYAYIQNVSGIIEIKDKIIAVNTAGDNEQEMERTFKLFKEGFDIGICAVRTKGKTVKMLNQFVKDNNMKSGTDLLFINKLCITNVADDTPKEILKEMNEAQAEFMFELLQDELKN